MFLSSTTSIVILVFGSVLPSLITIISNIVSVYRIRSFNRTASNQISFSRRRTDDTRRVLFVITIECLLAILNSWLMDIVLALVYCKKKLLADDDCPMFLQQNYDFLLMCDLFNSGSNIVLHCLCGRHFYRELRVMLQSCSRFIKGFLKDICCCSVKFDDKSNEEEYCISYNVSTSRVKKDSSSSNPSQIYLNIQSSSRLLKNRCFGCRWYFNRPPLSFFRQVSSNVANSQPGARQKILSQRHRSLTQPTNLLRTMQKTSSLWNDRSDVHHARREGHDVILSLN